MDAEANLKNGTRLMWWIDVSTRQRPRQSELDSFLNAFGICAKERDKYSSLENNAAMLSVSSGEVLCKQVIGYRNSTIIIS